jgi:uncharacterized protein YggE
MTKRWFALIVAAALTAAGAGAETFSITIPDTWMKAVDAKEKPLLLTVTGTGNVNVAPDRVVVTATIYNQDKKLGVAFDDNQYKVSRLTELLAPLDIPRKNVATSNLTISPVYKENSSKVDYYYVSRTIMIFQDDMDHISPVLDALVDAGVGDIGNIGFEVKDIEAKRDEALTKAAADCRATADRLAAAMGARVVVLKDLKYDWGGYGADEERTRGGRYEYAAREALATDNVYIAPREVTTSVYVYATYELAYNK